METNLNWLIIAGVAVITGVVIALVLVTKTVHAAFRLQNMALQERLTLKETELVETKKAGLVAMQKLESAVQEAEIQFNRLEAENKDLRHCLNKIGLNATSLTASGMDFWREGALDLIVCSVDDKRLDSYQSEKTNAGIMATAKALFQNAYGTGTHA